MGNPLPQGYREHTALNIKYLQEWILNFGSIKLSGEIFGVDSDVGGIT